MRLYIYTNLELSPNKLRIKKGRDKTTQLLFMDMKHLSIFADTKDLLEYLENLTEKVRLIDFEQNPKDL